MSLITETGPLSNFSRKHEISDSEGKMLLLAAWRAVQEQFAPSQTSAPGRAAEDPRLDFVPLAKTLTSRLCRLKGKKMVLLPPAGPLEAHAEVLCRRRRRRNYGSNMRRRWRARRDRRCARVAAWLALPPGQPREPKRGRGQQLGQGPLHKGWARILLNSSAVQWPL
jgi:hypothetical protein